MNAIRIRNDAFIDQAIDHTAWGGVFRPGMVPSDVDAVFHVRYVLDSAGRILMADFKHGLWDWGNMSRGQWTMYRSFVAAGRGDIVAAICSHQSPAARRIDSRRDVTQFNVCWNAGSQVAMWHKPRPGRVWEEFVRDWYNGPPRPFAAKWLRADQ